ncbi:sensor histidine kinase, partial [Paracoccus sp. PXZ]
MRLRGPHFALLTIASFVLLFVYSLAQLIHIDHTFRKEIVEGNLWTATQADREAQNLMLTLYRVSLDRDIDDVLLRFDIFYSRIALMTDRPQIDYFHSIGVGEQVV